MVVGGYNFNATNGLISDVELVSTNEGNACSKRVRPLPGVDLVSKWDEKTLPWCLL